MKKSITKIVITGGPCSGKTTSHSKIEEEFSRRGYKTVIISETATELITGGVTAGSMDCGQKFQELLMSLQLSKEACAIERTRTGAACVHMRGGTIAMANHFQSMKFAAHNKGWDPDIIRESKDRSRLLKTNLKHCGTRASLERVAGSLDGDPVLNDETRQMMAFDPSRGELLVWAI